MVANHHDGEDMAAGMLGRLGRQEVGCSHFICAQEAEKEPEVGTGHLISKPASDDVLSPPKLLKVP